MTNSKLAKKLNLVCYSMFPYEVFGNDKYVGLFFSFHRFKYSVTESYHYTKIYLIGFPSNQDLQICGFKNKRHLHMLPHSCK